MDELKKYFDDFKQVVLGYYPLTEEAFARFENIIKFKLVKKNEILLQIGTISRQLYFICKGAVIAYYVDEEGNTYNKNIFLENEFAGSTVSALLNTPSEFTLEAIEDTVLISIHYDSYRTLIDHHIEFKNFYISYLEKNWIIDKEQREISLVMENATARYLKFLTLHPDIDKRIPLQHIASNLGISPTQLSRIRKDLKEK